MVQNSAKLFLIIIFISTFSSCQDNIVDIASDNDAKKNNILLIIVDDVGLDATIGYSIGSQKPNMPNLQNLISSGIKFNNVWSNPVCSPTRSTILTGKYGYRTSILNVDNELSTNENSLHNYLTQNSNYSSALIGKWHLSGTPADHNHPNNLGIDHYSGMIGGGIKNYSNWTFSENGNTSNTTQYSTTKLTNEAINWINNQKSEWFMWLAYNAPHTPFHLPPIDLHNQGQLPTDQASIDSNPLPYYLAMIEAIDSEMGRLFNSISKKELANTTIIFIGDNGTPSKVVQQYNSNRAKGSLYKGGINVPMIISGNQVKRFSQDENALINTTDLFATITELCGISNQNIHDSKSFISLLTSSFNSNSRDYIYSEIGNQNYTIRNSTHKYIHFENGNEALFNLNNNPFEFPNLLNANQLPLSETNNLNKTELIKILEKIRN